MRRRLPEQRLFGFASWGGKRAGAGRKPAGRLAGVSHARRPKLAARHPVHVTMKLSAGLPSLRSRAPFRRITAAFSASRVRPGFRLVQFSVQSNHVHLVVEADGTRELSRGMQGLGVRVARSLNRLWRRRGKLFADRYHARILRTPREVRNALAYVLRNSERHGTRYLDGPDPFSSGDAFDGEVPEERGAQD